MSRENVEVVRAGLEAWNAGDMVAVRDGLAPDVVLHALAGWPESDPAVGRDAAIRQYEQLRATWEADRLNVVEDLVDAGDRVLGRLIWEAVGHGPAAAIEVTVVWSLREGAITRVEYFWDHAEALEAAGLRE